MIASVEVLANLSPGSTCGVARPNSPNPLLDLCGPGGLGVGFGLTIEAREQLGGDLGPLRDRKPKGLIKNLPCRLIHVSILPPPALAAKHSS